ncbi:hypothetical protein ABMA27_010256 [Loxostege sticticalis]|uniref:Uncharacterized protein n=1 Tax=Loxostege sticticalis TaxID=481309 RepID=A0ABR3H552_LOXSC
MSVVAISGVPAFWNLKRLVFTVAKVVKGQFDALNFYHGKAGTKTAYIRVSERLDPLRVVESINRLKLNKCELTAFIPDHVPDMPLASMSKLQKKKGKGKSKEPMNITPEQVLASVHNELLTELQSKYTGLYDLSQKTSHQLLDEIAETIFKRLKHIMETNPASHGNCFKLSSFYRKAHPHFGDFQQILMTLHRIQDAAGVPRTQVSEQELAAFSTKPSVIDSVPWGKLQAWNVKYADRIAKKITEHIERLDAHESTADTPEDAARKRVRAALKKLAPYMSSIVTDVASQHVTPDQNPVYKMRIYGEPFLPNRQVLDPILRKLRATYVTRSSRIFNMVRFNVQTSTFPVAAALNGKDLGGAKLVARLSLPPKYKTRLELRQAMATALDPNNQMDPMDLVDMEEEIDFEGGESWDT